MNDAELASLSVKELRELKGRVEQAISVVAQREKTDLMDKMAALAAEHGLSLNEIVGELDLADTNGAARRK